MSYHILLIDDNAEMADNISSILQLARYDVTYAPNGKAGVDLAKKNNPDLILCDIMMPELDGYGVVQILRNDPETANIPFIFLTCKTDKNDFRLGMNLGADDYITKPFDSVDLLKVIEMRLKKNELLKSLETQVNLSNAELLKTNKELKHANEQLEQFAFLASHHLQEPLRKVQTFSNLLSHSEAHLNDYAKKYLDKINTSAFRMSTLLQDLLRFSILIRNDERKMVKVDLNDVLKNVIKDFEVIIERSKAAINLSLLPTIYGEAVQMNQLFNNLISNAVKFSKGNLIINILSREVTSEDFSKHPELMKDAHYVAISVNDNGIGFEQKYTNKIFTLFQRLNDKEGAEGTGIGLAICKKIVEDHGGSIFAIGKENVGATFTVFLPAQIS